MQTRKLHARDFFRPGDAFHFSRTVLSRKPPRAPHTHDFHELFWLTNGTARHRVNDSSIKLTEGDVVFIRPDDRHSLQATADETHLANLALPTKLVQGLAQQAGNPDQFFWSTKPLPHMTHRNPRQLAELSHRALALETGPRSTLAANAFLLSLLAELETTAPPIADSAPEWLRDACRAALQPHVFREGASGLVQACGKAHAHVSRTMRHHMNQTPSGFINSVRMDHAARCLVGSSDTLAEIARDCGIPNLSHFHSLFRERHGMTPLAYRRAYQRDVIQPL